MVVAQTVGDFNCSFINMHVNRYAVLVRNLCAAFQGCIVHGVGCVGRNGGVHEGVAFVLLNQCFGKRQVFSVVFRPR